jgi:hypothetical protein
MYVCMHMYVLQKCVRVSVFLLSSKVGLQKVQEKKEQVCMYACMYVCICTLSVYTHTQSRYVCMHACAYAYVQSVYTHTQM